MTTDFENRTKHQVNIILCAFFHFWPTSPYPTKQCQSILQLEISIHFTHFQCRPENLGSNDTTFVRVILFSEMLPKTMKISLPCDR